MHMLRTKMKQVHITQGKTYSMLYHEMKKEARETPYKWYFVTKIVLTYCAKKKCSSDREKLLKFAKFLRSLEHFFRTVDQNNFW